MGPILSILIVLIIMVVFNCFPPPAQAVIRGLGSILFGIMGILIITYFVSPQMTGPRDGTFGAAMGILIGTCMFAIIHGSALLRSKNKTKEID